MASRNSSRVNQRQSPSSVTVCRLQATILRAVSSVTRLGNLYGRLCGELAAALARRVTKVQYKPDWTVIEDVTQAGMKGAAFYHHSMSAFEAATVALNSYGLPTPVPRDDLPGETWYCLHALTVDADEMPDLLANSVVEGDDRLPKLLETFLAIFCGYDDISDRHALFTPPAHLLAAVSMLARTGYAEKAEDQFRWVEKIAPAMKAAYIWDENSASFSETDEEAVETNAQLAWQTMPEILKKRLRSGQAGVRELTKILALGWHDGQWHAYRLKDPVCLGNELTVARRLIEIAEAERR